MTPIALSPPLGTPLRRRPGAAPKRSARRPRTCPGHLRTRTGSERARARDAGSAQPPVAFGRARFDALVAPHLDAMQRAARRVVKSDDLAWDAVQDVLLRLWQRGWLPEDPAGALRHLAGLAALQVLRGRARRERHEQATCQAPVHRSAGPPSPLEAAEQRELRLDLGRALVALPPDQRRVFELFELEGHDYACIAQQLQVPVGTVRSRLSRARAALRARLECSSCLEELGVAPASGGAR